MKNILEKVKEFATEAHGDQQRKYTPDPYIIHPVKVMEICQKHSSDISLLSAALLHDVLEDTSVSQDEILRFLKKIMDENQAHRTLKFVVELTDVYMKKDYPQWNRRKRKSLEMDRIEKTSPEAQTIKYADIIDNCKEIVSHDPAFGRVFLHECYAMLKKIPGGNPELYNEAMKLVETKLKEIKLRESKPV